MPQRNFADFLMEQIGRKRSQLVVGLDPRVDRLPGGLRSLGTGPASPPVGKPRDEPREARLTAAAAARAVAAFNCAVLDAVAQHAVAVKCQVAFYEQYGCEGMRAYADTLQCARDHGVIVIADIKRNDIAGTAAAYATAHLGTADGTPAPSIDFIADAVTINPYFGSDGVMPFVEAAAANGRGVFALVKTSNPSSVEIQNLDVEGEPLYRRVAALVEQWGAPYRGRGGYSLLGAVVGATFPGDLATLRELMPAAPFLVPGVGAQGGRVEDVAAAFDREGLGAVVNSSRDIIFAWERSPYKEQYGEARWQEAVAAAAADLRAKLWQATH